MELVSTGLVTQFSLERLNHSARQDSRPTSARRSFSGSVEPARAVIGQTFVEWAAQTINKSFWAGAFYRQQRAKGSSHQVAVRALAFKWIRIVYCCWQTRKRYDESRYLMAPMLHGSPLVAGLPTKAA